jgi:hypothetical protein
MTKSSFSTALVCGLFAMTGAARASFVVQTAVEGYFSGNGWLAEAQYNFATTGTYFNNPNGGSVSGTTDSTGTLTSAYDRASLSDSDSGASGYAYANLASGKLGVMGSAGGYYSEAMLQAQFSDVLHFSITGANVNTITDISVTYTVDGSMLESDFGNAALSSALDFGSATEGAKIGDMLSGGICSTGPCVYSQLSTGWVSASFSPSSPGLVEFQGIYALTGSSGDIPIFATLSLNSAVTGTTGSANDDYSNTAAIMLSLPPGVSYTSDSGVFLSQTSSAPEPATLFLAGLSLAAIGAVKLKKK